MAALNNKEASFTTQMKPMESQGTGWFHARSAPGKVVGRLAPSPTGFMHLGNAWAFWLAWLDVRSRGGRLILRMEDIDPARSKPPLAEAIRQDLKWLGLDWGEEAPPQSERAEAYEEALKVIESRGLIYPCFCTRKELRELAGAPQVGDEGAPYPGLCRNLSSGEREKKPPAADGLPPGCSARPKPNGILTIVFWGRKT